MKIVMIIIIIIIIIIRRRRRRRRISVLLPRASTLSYNGRQCLTFLRWLRSATGVRSLDLITVSKKRRESEAMTDSRPSTPKLLHDTLIAWVTHHTYSLSSAFWRDSQAAAHIWFRMRQYKYSWTNDWQLRLALFVHCSGSTMQWLTRATRRSQAAVLSLCLSVCLSLSPSLCAIIIIFIIKRMLFKWR